MPLRTHVLCSDRRVQARIANSFAASDTPLEVIQNGNSVAPPMWPANATPEDVRQMPGDQVDNILQHYLLPTDGLVRDRQRRLLMYLGVR